MCVSPGPGPRHRGPWIWESAGRPSRCSNPLTTLRAQGGWTLGSHHASFEVADALNLSLSKRQFDSVIDSGLFHVFSDEQRARFTESLGRVVRPGGTYFLMCFSDQQPGDWGPRRVTQAEIRSVFSDGWRVNYIQASAFETNEGDAHAWLASISRL